MAMGGTGLGLTTADGRRPRVAIVGGTPAGAMVAGVLIQQFGCSPINSATAAAVLALVSRDDPVDLVVIDLALPDMDAILAVELSRAVGARGAMPVVALIDNRAQMTAPRARAAGFAAAVVKPYSPRELYGAMHVALFGPATLVSGTA
jgi:CheY-like chemotaxis protein